MYSEVHLAPETSLAIQQKLKEARDKDLRSAFSSIWDRVQKGKPRPIRHIAKRKTVKQTSENQGN